MAVKKRKIAIFTGNRAEYGLQVPIIRAVAEHPWLVYYLLVGGAHLDQDFGYTSKEIRKDGFKVWGEVKSSVRIAQNDDTLFATVQAIGDIILNLSAQLKRLRPDILVVYADRFEGLAAIIAGSQMGIPVAHIEGGDVTEGGALDDYVRHAMTKLAHLHFTTNREAYQRILRLGEERWRVFNTGFPAIDLIRRVLYATPQEVAERTGVDVCRPVVLFTQHSVTTEVAQTASQIMPSLEALVRCAREGVQIVATYPNNDAGGRCIIKKLEGIKGKKNIFVIPNLGRYLYHGVLHVCGALGPGVCAGNSSSGIKETPAFGCPFVNIGTRQQGRLRASNVIDTDYDARAIYAAIQKSLFDAAFRRRCRCCKNPYGEGRSGNRIAQVLATVPLDKKLLQKKITY